MDSKKQWYAVNAYPGSDESVKRMLRQTAEALNLGDAFGEILISNGRTGSILVEMELSDATRNIVLNTPKVTRFVSETPMTDEEVALHRGAMEQIETNPENIKSGDQVKIIDGPFSGDTGVVDVLDLTHNTLKVNVMVFGSMKLIEMKFSQVQKT